MDIATSLHHGATDRAVMQELQVPLGLRSLYAARPLYPRLLYPMGTVLNWMLYFQAHVTAEKAALTKFRENLFIR